MGVEEAILVLKGLRSEAMLPLGQTLSTTISSISENEYDRRLDYVELLAAYFEQADPKVYVPADWLMDCWTTRSVRETGETPFVLMTFTRRTPTRLGITTRNRRSGLGRLKSGDGRFTNVSVALF